MECVFYMLVGFSLKGVLLRRMVVELDAVDRLLKVCEIVSKARTSIWDGNACISRIESVQYSSWVVLC